MDGPKVDISDLGTIENTVAAPTQRRPHGGGHLTRKHHVEPLVTDLPGDLTGGLGQKGGVEAVQR